MNLRDSKIIPPVITRNRRRGSYMVAAKVTAKAITRDKALALGNAIDNVMRELGLVGVAKLSYIVRQKGSKNALRL